MLRLPDAVQRLLGEGLDQPLVALEQQRTQRLLEDHHVGDGEVHALRAGRRHGVGGIADQGDATVQQLVRDEAAEPQHVALEDRAPRCSVVPGTRDCSSAQSCSSENEFGSMSGSHWKYMRCTVGLRWLMSANPFGELL